jgi:hypothetical protein
MNTTGSVYIVVSDAAKRERIVDDLRREGWTVVERPTAFHVLGDIADVIDGTDGTARERTLKIVVDAYARGCTGKSLEAGLRELGVPIPVEVIEQRT